MKFRKIQTTCLNFVTFILLLSVNTSYALFAQANLPSLAPVLKKIMPAIVNVAVQGGEGPVSDDSKSKGNKDSQDEEQQKDKAFEGLASGVIMDAEKGYLLTNAHVVKEASSISVTLNDGRRFKAKLVGADPASDVAVLQIKPEHLESIAIADSNQVQVGDFTIAIGNPFGLNLYGANQTATFGIVSATRRTNLSPMGVQDFIQTDAAINPGNSGGALVNLKGELIGINSAIISPFRGSVGIGLAIPINLARTVMFQIIKYGAVHRGLMGIFVQHVTPELADAFGFPDTAGALVSQVNKGSPAEQAGLRPGDMIREINNEKITDAAQVRIIIGLLRVGSAVSMKVLRDGKTITLDAKVVDGKRHDENLLAENPFLYGLALRNFDEELPLHGHIQGVQVTGAVPTSPAVQAGLIPGAVIVAANKKPVRTVEELQAIAAHSKGKLLVHVLVGPKSVYLVI